MVKEKADPLLFETIFNQVLSKYNSSSYLGNLDYTLLNSIGKFIYDKVFFFLNIQY